MMTGQFPWPPGDSEMARRIRAHDWTTTSLGPVEDWPQHLRTAVGMVLAMPGPASILWGPAHAEIYNDAYIAIARDGHPTMLGRPATDNWPDIYAKVFAPAMEAALAGRATRLTDFSVTLQGPNGQIEERAFDSTWSPIPDEAGMVTGALQILVEVTDRRRVEASLRESDARHRLLIESWTQATWEADPNGVVVSDSPSWRAYTGQPLEEWLGYGWLDAIHPDDRAYAERQWREATAAHGLVDAEFRLRAPDGGWRWTNVRAAPVLDAGGHIEKWAGMNIDIDARKRAETALRESEESYRTLFEAMDEAFAVVEVLRDEAGAWSDFRFLDANPAFMGHTSMPYPVGRTATELLGTPNPRWAQMYGQVLDTGKPLRVQESEGTLGRTFDLNIFNLDRERNRVAVLFTDITERNRAEAALRRSEECSRTILEGISEVFYALDREGRFLFASGSALKLWNKEAEEVIGRTLLDCFQSAGGHDIWEAHLRVMRTGVGEHLQTISPVLNRWIEADLSPIQQGGLSVAFRDVDARKRAETALHEGEERLRSLVQGIPQLVWRAFDTGALTWASPQWTAYTGQPEPDSHDHGWLAAVHPADREAVLAAWKRAQASGTFRADHRLRHAAESRYRWVESQALPVRDDQGRIVEWLGTTTDVEELRRAHEQELFIAELQHRGRNLLTVVGGIADQMLATSGSLEEFGAQFERRLAAVGRVQGLLSREAAARVSLGELVRLELAAHGADGIGDRVELEGPEAMLPSEAVQMLALALHELLTNALKHGALAAQQGRLTITWSERHDPGGRRLRLDWRESGVILPESVSARRRGFGLDLIEHSLSYELDAETAVRFGPDGLRCSIVLPLDDGPGAGGTTGA